MLALVTSDACQVEALVGYSASARRAVRPLHLLPDGPRAELPAPAPPPPIEPVVSPGALAVLRAGIHRPWASRASWRASSRGITSPATTSAKLTRQPLFGALADRRFPDALAWCEAARM